MPIALADLLVYALVFFAIAFAFASRKLTQAILGGLIAALELIPLIGGKLASPLKAAESAIVEACYAIEHGADKLAGATWHQTARLLNWTWREIRAHAAALAALAPPLADVLTIAHGLRSLVHRLTTTQHGSTARLKTLERELHGIERHVRHLEHDISKGIGEDVLPRLKHLDRELHRVTTKTIPAIETAEGADAARVSNLWDWVKRNVAVPGSGIFTGAVAVALSTLGLSWLRCNSNPFNNNRNACGLWGDLSDLLGLATLIVGAENFDTLVHAAQDLTEDGIRAFEDVFGLGG